MGIKVPVIGVAFSSTWDPTDLKANEVTLNEMAKAGGMPRPMDPAYYAANSSTELAAAFAQITGIVISCTFDLKGMKPPSPDDVAVKIDGVKVPRDKAHGAGLGLRRGPWRTSSSTVSRATSSRASARPTTSRSSSAAPGSSSNSGGAKVVVARPFAHPRPQDCRHGCALRGTTVRFRYNAPPMRVHRRVVLACGWLGRGARRAIDGCARAGPRVRWRASLAPAAGAAGGVFVERPIVPFHLGLRVRACSCTSRTTRSWCARARPSIGTPLDGARQHRSAGVDRTVRSPRARPAPADPRLLRGRRQRHAARRVARLRRSRDSSRRSASSAAATPPSGGFSARPCPSRSPPETTSPCADRPASPSSRAFCSGSIRAGWRSSRTRDFVSGATNRFRPAMS